jgi:hypothetical protein
MSLPGLSFLQGLSSLAGQGNTVYPFGVQSGKYLQKPIKVHPPARVVVVNMYDTIRNQTDPSRAGTPPAARAQ